MSLVTEERSLLKNSNRLPVVSKQSTGARPPQHLVVEFGCYYSWFLTGFPWSQTERSMSTSLSICSTYCSSFETDIMELNPVVSGTPIILMYSCFHVPAFVPELCHPVFRVFTIVCRVTSSSDHADIPVSMSWIVVFIWSISE